MGIFNKIFGGKSKNQTIEKQQLPTIEAFPLLNDNDRMSVIMIVGDSCNLDYFHFLKYAIVSDKDIGVGFAALKRIHLFKNHPDTIPMLLELKNSEKAEKLEPYFSMALSRLGIISLEEFKEKIDKS